MAKAREQQPELVLLARNAQDIFLRFQGWPDLLVTDGGFAEKLRLPVFEQLPLSRWREQLGGLAAASLPGLRAGVEQLTAAWTKSNSDSWAGVAHSLLVHWLLWSVGGRVLLLHLGCPVAGLVVAAAEESDCIWPGFIRSNQEFGVSCLLGGKYGRMSELRSLLKGADVAKSLATLQTDRSLLVRTTGASRVLNRVSGLSSGRTDDGSYRATWPVMSAPDLGRVEQQLAHLAAGLSLLQRQAVLPLAAAVTPELPQYGLADLSLGIYALLVQALIADWLEAKLLSQPVQPLVDGLS